jgi:hypothetical protein
MQYLCVVPSASRPGGPASRRPPKVTLRVSNFKAVGAAELSPVRLTVIAGANSSGKSSLLQAALFFAQSYGQPQTVINGDLVRLGEPIDVVRDGADEVGLELTYDMAERGEAGPTATAIPFGMRVQLAPRGDNLSPIRLTLWRDGDIVLDAVEKSDSTKLPLAVDETPLQLVNASDLSLPDESYLSVTGITPQRLLFRASESVLRRDFESLVQAAQTGSNYAIEELLRLPRFAEQDQFGAEFLAKLSEFRHRPPRRPFDLDESDLDVLFRMFVEVQAPDGWSTEIVRGRFAVPPRTMRHLQEADPDPYLPVLSKVGAASDRMERLASTIRYLGPLRDDPRFAYPLGHTVRNLPVGEKGEFTAGYLERNRRMTVRYVRPDGDRVINGLLWTAVSEWCDYLGIAEKVTVTSRGKLGHQLGLEVGGHQRDPTAIGVGASQLLPVVVLVLGAPDDAIVFLEQPELHLHPKIQSRLGDFFSFARPQIRLIVETHSEYLITRLRLRAAEGTLDVDQLAVLFASQGKVEPVDPDHRGAPDLFTEFTRLGLDELGDFNLWPVDFFDTLGKDTVALAQAITRKLDQRQSEP